MNKKNLIDWAVVIVIVLLLRAYLVQAYNIPSSSMEPTLLVGDFVLVDKLIYKLTEPKVGDVVVFKEGNLELVKRIIAKGGDEVEFFKEGRVYGVKVNGKKYELKKVGSFHIRGESFELYKEFIPNYGEHLILFKEEERGPAGVCAPIRGCYEVVREELCALFTGIPYACKSFKVPEGEYFVMGDNRDNSQDSRFFGFIERSQIEGKPFVIYFSGDIPPITPADVKNPIITALRQIVLALLSPRFDRVGKPLIK